MFKYIYDLKYDWLPLNGVNVFVYCLYRIYTKLLTWTYFLSQVSHVLKFKVKFQSDMFDNMSIIVLTQIHKSFVHFFGIGSVSSYFLWLRLLLDLKMRKKKERQTFRPHMGQWSQNVGAGGPHHRCIELIVSSSFNQPMAVFFFLFFFSYWLLVQRTNGQNKHVEPYRLKFTLQLRTIN